MTSRRLGLGIGFGFVIVACGGATVDFPDASTQDGGADTTLICNGGTVACGDKCVQVSIDPSNCGSCFNSCSVSEVCASGKCQTNCPIGYTLCGGGCANLQGDPQNCGKCGNVCGGANANAQCTNGQCQSGVCCSRSTTTRS